MADAARGRGTGGGVRGRGREAGNAHGSAHRGRGLFRGRGSHGRRGRGATDKGVRGRDGDGRDRSRLPTVPDLDSDASASELSEQADLLNEYAPYASFLLEERYERSRQRDRDRDLDKPKVKEMLPVILPEGQIVRQKIVREREVSEAERARKRVQTEVDAERDAAADGDSDHASIVDLDADASPDVSEDDEAASSAESRDDGGDEAAEATAEASGADSSVLDELAAFERRQQHISEARERIALLAAAILEDPQANIEKFDELHELTSDEDVTVCKLALLSELAVFKDVLPGYRLRPPTEKETAVRVSKAVQAMRDFEAGLLSAYRRFVRLLQRIISETRMRMHPGKKPKRFGRGKARAEDEPALSKAAMIVMRPAAIRCVHEMLAARPNFNFREDLVRLLVPLTNDKQTKVCVEACAAIADLFATDPSGELSLDLVRLIGRMVKHDPFDVRPEALNTFLRLRLDEAALSSDIKAREEERPRKGKKDGKKQGAGVAGASKGHKVTAEERAERAELRRELAEGEAEIDPKQRKNFHSRIVEAVFVTYFRIIKKAPSSPLLSSALEGIGRFAHLISVDYLGDMLQALKDLVASGTLGLAESLHCAIGAFNALKKHGDVVVYDPKDFHALLYRLLPELALPQSWPHVRIAVRALHLMLSERRTSSTERIAAFVKRLLSLALCVPANAALALLAIVRSLLTRYPRTRQLLDTETTASGVYYPLLPDPEHSNAFASTAWEVSALLRHWHPFVAEYTAHVVSEDVFPAHLSALTAVDLYERYDDSSGAFRPPMQRPRTHPLTGRASAEPVFITAQRKHRFDSVFTLRLRDEVAVPPQRPTPGLAGTTSGPESPSEPDEAMA